MPSPTDVRRHPLEYRAPDRPIHVREAAGLSPEEVEAFKASL